MTKLLAFFICTLIPFAHAFGQAQVSGIQDEEALRLILTTSQKRIKYFVRIKPEPGEYSFQRMQKKDQVLVQLRRKFPELEIVESYESSLPKKLFSVFPQVPYRFIDSNSDLYPEVGKLLDKVALDILNTPTGQRICRSATDGLHYLIMHIFGVSAEIASEVQRKSCPHSEKFMKLSPSDRKLLDQSYLTSDRQSPFIFLEFAEDVDLPFESWTANRGSLEDQMTFGIGKTYIHLEPKRFKLSSLYRAMAHEIVMRVDYRSHLPPVDEIKNLMDPSSACLALSTAVHPQVRLSMSIVRALQWENQILKELGYLKPEEADNFAKKSCVRKIQQMIPYTVRFKEMLTDEAHMMKSILQHFQCPMTLENVSLDQLESTFNLRTRDPKGNESSFCESLINNFSIAAEVSYSSAFIPYFNPGPRPPIGKGTGGNVQEDPPSTGEVSPTNLERYNVFGEQKRQ